MLHTLIAGTMLTLMLAAAGPGDDDAAVRKQFNDRVSDYMKLRKKAAEGIPALKPKSTAEQIQANRVALSQAIRNARLEAVQGTVFTPEVKQFFLKTIRSEMRGADGAPSKDAVKQGNPASEGPATVVVKVNAPYPDSAPLSTVPATLLLRLPELPKQLDYRFVGRYLILRDTEANLIIDYIPTAVP
jgi:hypothetical protein